MTKGLSYVKFKLVLWSREFTTYLQNGGALEHAQTIANHESLRKTKLYDRTREELSIDEVERIKI
jgi:hypothetical protein